MRLLATLLLATLGLARGVPLGIVACGVFVLGGLVNGYLLFGAARLAGILVNLAVATVIVVVLWSHARHPDRGSDAEAP